MVDSTLRWGAAVCAAMNDVELRADYLTKVIFTAKNTKSAKKIEEKNFALGVLGGKNMFYPSTSRPYLDLRTTRTTFGMLKERDVQIHRHFRFIIKAEK
jgi:hypothetical protein